MANLKLSNEQIYNLWKLLTTIMFMGTDSKNPALNELGTISKNLLPTVTDKIIEIQRSLPNEEEVVI